MMVYFPILVTSQGVHVGVDQDNNEGVNQVKQKPDIHHFHVGSLGKLLLTLMNMVVKTNMEVKFTEIWKFY